MGGRQAPASDPQNGRPDSASAPDPAGPKNLSRRRAGTCSTFDLLLTWPWLFGYLIEE
jgi:hypothetical protein